VRPSTGEFGGGDIPGDYSPDGTQFVFVRAKPGADPNARHQRGALFVENTDGTCLHRIVPFGLANSHDNAVARWSPDGSAILFASDHGLLFVVHPDGTGMRRIPLDTGGGFAFAFAPGWSPDGTSIVFSLFLDTTEQSGKPLRNLIGARASCEVVGIRCLLGIVREGLETLGEKLDRSEGKVAKEKRFA
jgi:Tol biopolymer transport system component